MLVISQEPTARKPFKGTQTSIAPFVKITPSVPRVRGPERTKLVRNRRLDDFFGSKSTAIQRNAPTVTLQTAMVEPCDTTSDESSHLSDLSDVDDAPMCPASPLSTVSSSSSSSFSSSSLLSSHPSSSSWMLDDADEHDLQTRQIWSECCQVVGSTAAEDADDEREEEEEDDDRDMFRYSSLLGKRKISVLEIPGDATDDTTTNEHNNTNPWAHKRPRYTSMQPSITSNGASLILPSLDPRRYAFVHSSESVAMDCNPDLYRGVPYFRLDWGSPWTTDPALKHLDFKPWHFYNFADARFKDQPPHAEWLRNEFLRCDPIHFRHWPHPRRIRTAADISRPLLHQLITLFPMPVYARPQKETTGGKARVKVIPTEHPDFNARVEMYFVQQGTTKWLGLRVYGASAKAPWAGIDHYTFNDLMYDEDIGMLAKPPESINNQFPMYHGELR
jgi:hypothetical protein